METCMLSTFSTPIKIPTTAIRMAHVDMSEHLLEEENKFEKPA